MSRAIRTKNDIAWNELFEKYHILDRVNIDGHFNIKSTEINPIRQARLMTKFDHDEHRPAIFRDNGLSILPISRGEYVIAKIKAYEILKPNETLQIEYFELPSYLDSLDFNEITSEATAINCAFISGILSHFLEEEDIFLTVSGRMSSGVFNFSIDSSGREANRLHLLVENCQIEVDGGFEGHNSLSLIEAKCSIPYSFLIRQLYFPYRLWKNKIQKPVRSIFLTYTNRIFHLYEYEFETPSNYNSLSLVKEQRYSLEPLEIRLDDIEHILDSVATVQEPKISFPQADSFERVINLCEHLHTVNEEGLSHEDITHIYNFDKRQTQYYTNAGRYLGLIAKKNSDGIQYYLSERGKTLFRQTYRKRQLGFVKAILEHSVFANGLKLYLRKFCSPSKAEIVELMRSADLYRVKQTSVYERRAQTIRSWLDWIIGLQGQY